jgi:hypothetical protein
MPTKLICTGKLKPDAVKRLNQIQNSIRIPIMRLVYLLAWSMRQMMRRQTRFMKQSTPKWTRGEKLEGKV